VPIKWLKSDPQPDFSPGPRIDLRRRASGHSAAFLAGCEETAAISSSGAVTLGEIAGALKCRSVFGNRGKATLSKATKEADEW
jgi:hypothetical protein